MNRRRFKVKGVEYERMAYVCVRARSAESALAFFGYSAVTHIVVDDGPCDLPNDTRHSFRIFERGDQLTSV